MKKKVDEFNELLNGKSPVEVLYHFINLYPETIIFGSSMGAEDQVLTDMIIKIDAKTKIFTLDTGRLFSETYELIEKTNKKYGINIQLYFPDYKKVEEMVSTKGINLFYTSIVNRKLCCSIRKSEPSSRALKGNKVWISGIRRDQTISRFYNKLVEWDDSNNIIKINPLLNWSEKQVWEYIKENDIPYNVLHDKMYSSIGCQPCTRAIRKDEDVRAGRWWWEQSEHKECGLHNS